MKHCNGCDAELVVGDNWLASMERNCDYKCNSCVAEYRVNNREKIAVKRAEYHIKNRERILAQNAEYQRNNPAKANASTAKRHAAKLLRTPKWLNPAHWVEINAMYEYNEIMLGDWEVDHIVPLQGEFVSGLHVPWNLQVLSQSENGSKSNRYTS